MHNNDWLAFDVAYVTIEMLTAFAIGAGKDDGLFDSVFVADANGLPCIPGESLAGVLRHAVAGSNDPAKDEVCCKAFGFQARDEGQASLVRVSYAHVHNQADKPVPFISAVDDAVLRFLRAGVGRDHVRIGGDGTAVDKGKFDVLLVPAGARFTFELMVSRNCPVSLADLVECLAQPHMRLGGKSRRGIGQFRLACVRVAHFDLQKDLARYSKLSPNLPEAVESKDLKAHLWEGIPTWRAFTKKEQLTSSRVTSDSAPWLHATLTLEPVGTWVFGGGARRSSQPRNSGADSTDEKDWERLPMCERRVVWNKGCGSVITQSESHFLIPGSSVKGALRHRTAYHARRLKGDWLNPQAPHDAMRPTAEETELFGSVKSENEEQGSPGRLLLSDTYLEQAPYEAQQHVSLDRFTQGPMDHVLFDELSLGKAKIKLELSLLQPELESSRLALEAALEDLCHGRLALGAGRGHGLFRGEIRWKDGRGLQREVAHA